MIIAAGATAPDFELPSQQLTAEGRPGRVVRLADFRGEKVVVLAFYPLDFSPTCTTENCSFREDLSAFEAAGAALLGVSVDSVWCHKAYAEAHGLTYPLLADFHPKGAVASAYGVYLAEKGITARATVVIGKDGVVVHAEEHPIGAPRSNAALLAAVQSAASRTAP